MSPRPSVSSLTARGRDGPARTGLCLSEFAFPRDALVNFIHALDAIFELAAVLRELLGHCVHAARYVATERGLDGHNLTDSELSRKPWATHSYLWLLRRQIRPFRALPATIRLTPLVARPRFLSDAATLNLISEVSQFVSFCW